MTPGYLEERISVSPVRVVLSWLTFQALFGLEYEMMTRLKI